MVGQTCPYAQIIQLTMPIAQLPITNFIFHMALVWAGRVYEIVCFRQLWLVKPAPTRKLNN